MWKKAPELIGRQQVGEEPWVTSLEVKSRLVKVVPENAASVPANRQAHSFISIKVSPREDTQFPQLPFCSQSDAGRVAKSTR
jgi:hypothetical protein